MKWSAITAKLKQRKHSPVMILVKASLYVLVVLMNYFKKAAQKELYKRCINECIAVYT